MDEKSMISLTQLAWIDKRLRQIFSDYQDKLFKGLNIILFGDFAQLPPVCETSLYEDRPLLPRPLHYVGRQAYHAFTKSISLKKIMRQQGKDPTNVQFRQMLQQLRDGPISEENWRLLLTQVQRFLDAEEVELFRDFFRVFPTRAAVMEHNTACLKESERSVMVIRAEHTRPAAKSATTEEAENLQAEI
ncbi:MAG: hypothetical protein Q9187_000330 [Circinaria calcarea]